MIAESYKTYTSNVYENFILHEFNRSVEKIKKLLCYMRIIGFGPWPIIVKRHATQKDKYIIIDGHHRFHCARMLGLSVVYIIWNGDIQPWEPPGDTRWSLKDIMNGHAKTGNENYIKLRDFVEITNFPISVAIPLLEGISSYNSNKTSFKAGRYQVTQEGIDRGETIANAISSLEAVDAEVARMSNFIKAVLRFIWLSEFDIHFFVDKVKKYPFLFKKKADVKQFSDMVEEIYNHNSKEKKALVIAADNDAKNRNCIKGKN